ncbi:cyclase family protein [Candidatus Woesearchaeota archaeon]|nr:cyclase family protein [Candidatus Woesearchaeota archaeon]
MKIIDLSMPLDKKTPTYPGDPSLEIKQVAEIEKDSWNEKRIHINTHCGTHLDAPSHMISEGRTLDDFPLEAFSGKGIVIDVRKKEITLHCLKDITFPPKSVVLFLTGQADQRYQKYYENAKFLSKEVAKKLVEQNVKAVGIDSFSPDEEPFPIHKILLSKNILIIENLINLDKLVNRTFTILFFPLPIKEGDGAPCRAIAFAQ